MQLVYFASLREALGCAEENYTPPHDVTTVEELIRHLRTRSDIHAAALHSSKMLRVAVNQTHAKPDHPVSDEDEVAIFPPVTGG